jgi:hypothetical protein
LALKKAEHGRNGVALLFCKLNMCCFWRASFDPQRVLASSAPQAKPAALVANPQAKAADGRLCTVPQKQSFMLKSCPAQGLWRLEAGAPSSYC